MGSPEDQFGKFEFVSDFDIRISDLSMTVCSVVKSYHSDYLYPSLVTNPWFFDGGVDDSSETAANGAKQTSAFLLPGNEFQEA